MLPFDVLLHILHTFDLRPGYVRAFHNAVFEAIKDGKLTEEEIAALEMKREELGISSEALDAVRRDFYVAAFQAVSANEVITNDEWEELEQIQDYLGLQDVDIAKTKKELYRMRIMHELKQGNLPTFRSKGWMMKKGELVHWIDEMDRYELAENGESGEKLVLGKGMRFATGSHAPEDMHGWKKADIVTAAFTNRRIILRGDHRSEAISLSSILEADSFVRGILLHRNRRKPMLLLYSNSENSSIVGSILFQLLDQRLTT